MSRPRAVKDLGLLGNWAWCKVAGLGAGSLGGGGKPGEVGGVRPLFHIQDSGSSLKAVGTY